MPTPGIKEKKKRLCSKSGQSNPSLRARFGFLTEYSQPMTGMSGSKVPPLFLTQIGITHAEALHHHEIWTLVPTRVQGAMQRSGTKTAGFCLVAFRPMHSGQHF